MANSCTYLDEQQPAGHLVLAVVPQHPADPACITASAQYRVVLVGKPKSAILQSDSGSVLVDREQGAHCDARGCTLLQALGRLINSNGVTAVARCIGALGGQILVDVQVSFPLRLWTRLQCWKPGAAAALLFSHLRPLDESLPCDETRVHPAGEPAWRHSSGSEGGGPQADAELLPAAKAARFSLAKCYAEIPSAHSHAAAIAPPPQAAAAAAAAAVASAEHNGRPSLLALPPEILRRVLQAVSAAADLRAIAATCRLLRHLAADIVPGLSLALFPHQEVAVRWMLEREAATAASHPTIMSLTTKQGLPLFLCGGTGELTVDPPPDKTPCRGGFFCDEPGLGKTVTVMALVLKTRGTRPAPPAGATLFQPDAVGGGSGMQPAPFYTLPEADAPANCFHSAKRSRRRSGSLSGELLPASQISPVAVPGRQQSPRDLQRLRPSNGYCGDTQAPNGRHSCSLSASSPNGSSPSGLAAASAASQPPPAEQLPRHGAAPTAATQPAASQSAGAAIDASHGSSPPVTGRAAVRTPNGRARSPYASGSGVALPAAGQLAAASAAASAASSAVGAPACGCVSAFPGGSVANVSGEPARKRKRVCFAEEAGPAPVRNGLLAPPENAVHLSAATLVVVPAPLIGHWQHQLATHARGGGLRVGVLGEGAAKEPSPAYLASHFDVVLTTFSRLSTEWRYMKAPAKPSETDEKIRYSPLRQVHWFRMILDEGHKVGSAALTNKLVMAANLPAERRWVVTGTPTPGSGGGGGGSGTSAGLAALHPLLTALRHEPYGGPSGKRLWDEAIQKPFEAGCEEGRQRLMALLRGLMIRAAKSSIRSIPACVRRVTLLEFDEEHARSYNGLVEVIGLNLLLADWSDPDHKESLLNERRAKNKEYAREYLKNVKLSCCVAGNLDLRPSEPDVRETLELLALRAALPPPPPLEGHTHPWLPAAHPLAHIETSLRYGGSCDSCDAATRLLVVTPCAHLLCLDCARTDREKCPLASCGIAYKMQAVDDPARADTNMMPKWPVPEELIEWQPAWVNEDATGLDAGKWAPQWESTRSTKCDHLLQRLRELGAVPQPPSSPDSDLAAGFESAAQRDLLQDGAAAMEQLPDALQHDSSRSSGAGAAMAPAAASSVHQPQDQGSGQQSPKVIVFSQFWMHLLLIARQLEAAGVIFVVLKADRKPTEKAAALAAFQDDPAVAVLVMDETGSVGLDLSFASTVFLMEPLADTALEDQIVARAHRMGATRPITVETLVMKGTAEEEILSQRAQHDSSQDSGVATSAASQALSSRNNLLKALHRVATGGMLRQPQQAAGLLTPIAS